VPVVTREALASAACVSAAAILLILVRSWVGRRAAHLLALVLALAALAGAALSPPI
jgi:hypothetical protein